MDFETVGKFMLALKLISFFYGLAFIAASSWGIAMLVLHFL